MVNLTKSRAAYTRSVTENRARAADRVRRLTRDLSTDELIDLMTLGSRWAREEVHVRCVFAQRYADHRDRPWLARVSA